MPTTATPLRYPGGKSKYTSLFIDTLEMNDLKGCTFAEVFAGGAGAAVSLFLRDHVASILLNDLDVAIYSFWRSVKECPGDLVDLIRTTRISIAEWRRQRAIYNARDTRDPLSLGFATFFLNRCNHSGILGARPIGGLRQQGNYSIRSRYNKATSIAKIRSIAERADALEVFNLDGLSFLALLQKRYRRSKCLVYLDPPYYQKGPALYLNHFSQADHEALSESISRCSFPWVLSYDCHDSIVSLYDRQGCGMYRHSLRHTITGNQASEELIISRLRLPHYLRRCDERNGQ